MESAQSCFLLAAEPPPAAIDPGAFASTWATSPRQTRVGGFVAHPPGRFSQRRRFRSMFTPDPRASCYSTASGRAKWLSRDPIGEKGGHNVFAFAANSPVGRLATG